MKVQDAVGKTAPRKGKSQEHQDCESHAEHQKKVGGDPYQMLHGRREPRPVAGQSTQHKFPK